MREGDVLQPQILFLGSSQVSNNVVEALHVEELERLFSDAEKSTRLSLDNYLSRPLEKLEWNAWPMPFVQDFQY